MVVCCSINIVVVQLQCLQAERPCFRGFNPDLRQNASRVICPCELKMVYKIFLPLKLTSGDIDCTEWNRQYTKFLKKSWMLLSSCINENLMCSCWIRTWTIINNNKTEFMFDICWFASWIFLITWDAIRPSSVDENFNRFEISSVSSWQTLTKLGMHLLVFSPAI